MNDQISEKSDLNKIQSSKSVDIYESRKRNSNQLLPVFQGNLQNSSFSKKKNNVNMSIFDTKTSCNECNCLEEKKKLTKQIKDKEDQMICFQKQKLTEQIKNNEEKDILRQQNFQKDDKLIRKTKNLKELKQKYIKIKEKCEELLKQAEDYKQKNEKYEEDLKKKNEKYQELLKQLKDQKKKKEKYEELLKQAEDSKIKEKYEELLKQVLDYQKKNEKYKELLKQAEDSKIKEKYEELLKQVEDYKKKNEKQKELLQQGQDYKKKNEKYVELEIEQRKPRQEIDFRNSLLCGSIIVEQKIINNTYQQSLNTTQEKRLELIEVNENDQYQYQQQNMQWEKQAKMLIEKIRDLAIKFKLQQQVENLKNSSSDYKIEPSILNYLDEFFSQTLLEYNDKINKFTEVIDKKEQIIQELQRDYENDRQQYKQQLTQWEVEGEKLFQILQDSGFCSSSNFKIDPMQLHNLTEFCQKFLSENKTKIEGLKLEIQKNENRIKELRKVNESQKEEQQLQLIDWQNQTQKFTEIIRSIDNELSDKLQEIKQANKKMQKLQTKNQELESQIEKMIKIYLKVK